MNIAKIIENKTELQSIRQINPCKKIVFTSGCFDILHYGHICHLKESRSLGDLLVVAINSDESIKRLKGNSKPIIPEWQRIRVLQSLRYVDFIFLSINEQISNFAQTYPTSLKVSSNEALLFMRRYRFANCSCFSCCFKDAYPSSNVQ